MEEKDIISWVLGAHGALVPISLYVMLRLSNRTQLFEKTVGDINSYLARMRQLIRGVLERQLSPDFEQSKEEPTVIVETPNVTYTEKAQNPFGTEIFREVLDDFLNEECEFIAHYREVLRAWHRWSAWARGLSWITPMMLIWEILCVTYFGLFVKLPGKEIPQWITGWSFAPTAGLVVAFFLCWVICLIQLERIYEHKTRYHNL